MFLKLTTPNTYINEPGAPIYVNMSLVRQINLGIFRPYARTSEHTSIVQPPITVTVLYFDDEDFARVLETPEQILALLSAGSP